GCFSISSLGAIGGTAFTPIINAPEVAILGITRTFEKLVLVDGVVKQKRMLPLSLSYDHRVINGVDAARFCRYLAEQLQNPQQLLNVA
ncbi:MAG TPA: 2-oxo acid dehydrogenase subunit E2, partial [Pseudomonadales bacterium]|nr:2-oxo acid dehydrogenase subunit E2 [Pseudomonadales bacterium]